MRKPLPPAPAQRGVILIEVLIAILLFSLGVLAIVGLQATMIKSIADAKYRSEASYIAQERIGQIWADPANAATYVETNTDISTRLPAGKRTVTQPVTGQFIVRVTWQQPGPDLTVHQFITTAQITGG